MAPPPLRAGGVFIGRYAYEHPHPGPHRRHRHRPGARCGGHRAAQRARPVAGDRRAVRQGPAPARGHLPAFSRRLRPAHRPRAGDPFPRPPFLHWRGRAGAAGPRWPGGAAAAAGALPGGRRRTGWRRPPPPARPACGAPGRVLGARLPQRQDRPGPGRGHCRPDRRLYLRSRPQRHPFLVGRVLPGDPHPARRAHPPAHAGRGHPRFS